VNLTKALERVAEVADFVEEKSNNLALRERVIEIQEKLTGKLKDVKLLEPGRKFIRECDATVIEKEGSSHKDRHLFLFSDLLLITRPHKNQWEVKTVLHLDKLSSIKPAVGADKHSMLNLVVEEKLFSLVFKDESEKKTWLNDLVKLFTDCLELDTKKRSAGSHDKDKDKEVPPLFKSRTLRDMKKSADEKRRGTATMPREELKVTLNPLKLSVDTTPIKSARRSTIDHNQEPLFIQEMSKDNMKKSPSMDSFDLLDEEEAPMASGVAVEGTVKTRSLNRSGSSVRMSMIIPGEKKK